MPFPRRKESRANAEISDRVQSILTTKGLTLYQVSRRSRALYGKSSPYFIPHNLYYDLRNAFFSPSVYQIFAFSQISGYRFRDWVRVFGFDVQDITRLQVRLPPRRTMLLDTSLTDPNDWIGWFRNRQPHSPTPAMAPLRQLLEPASSIRVGAVSDSPQPHFLYAKVGREDAYAFPDVVPGSIVRVNPAEAEPLQLHRKGQISDRIFLIEHSQGLCCCRLSIPENNVILPVSNLLSYAQVELEYPREARILGAVDFEMRPLLRGEEPFVPRDLARRWKPRRLAGERQLGQILRRAREKMHFSLRQASVVSRRIAEALNDQRYLVSPSSLYEYEALDTAPRDFHKVITLCSLYGVELRSVLQAIGIDREEADRTESIPDHLVPRPLKVDLRDETRSTLGPAAGFLERLLQECREVPFFLRDSIEYFDHAGTVSLDDFFWLGGERDPLYPYLAKGLVALVNRRRRTPVHFTSRPVWQQPVYIIAKRDESYLAACCGVEDGTLFIHSYAQDFRRPAQFRQHRDAEVVGQIVAVARKLE